MMVGPTPEASSLDDDLLRVVADEVDGRYGDRPADFGVYRGVNPPVGRYSRGGSGGGSGFGFSGSDPRIIMTTRTTKLTRATAPMIMVTDQLSMT